MKRTTTCSPIVGQFFDTMIVVQVIKSGYNNSSKSKHRKLFWATFLVTSEYGKSILIHSNVVVTVKLPMKLYTNFRKFWLCPNSWNDLWSLSCFCLRRILWEQNWLISKLSSASMHNSARLPCRQNRAFGSSRVNQKCKSSFIGQNLTPFRCKQINWRDSEGKKRVWN